MLFTGTAKYRFGFLQIRHRRADGLFRSLFCGAGFTALVIIVPGSLLSFDCTAALGGCAA